MCSFEKLFRNNSGFFVYLLQNMNVRNICPVGHEPLFVQSAQIFNQNIPIRCAIFTKIRHLMFQQRFFNVHLPQNNLFSCISAFADLIPALIFNKSLIRLPAWECDHYNSPLWVSPFPAAFLLFHIASSPSGYKYSHFCDVSTYFSNFLRCI